ncbi:hypothetical protein [Nocardioides sp. CER19]|uniref:CG0192-related protein n=1 Tax=Nocardioides sp. CER19 TaxID=3038538 RepID=UPI00244D7479|nr:hypothetical protein [Nocardioides sp. CER19]MDH2414269.1 hypothetical protein [Nocardioides sp. CER19]
MAIVHVDATISPTKPELVAAWLATQPWAAGLGDLEYVGGYRFDDPDGEVGVEALLFRAGDRVLHLPLTYRGAPLEGADELLVCTMSHTALGQRWVYDASGDPVAVRAFLTAILTGGEQAAIDVERDGEIVERRTPAVRAKGSGSAATGPSAGPVSVTSRDATAVVEAGGHELSIARLLPVELSGRETLTASWDGGEAVVATVG